MKTELEPNDIESIANKTAEMLKPLISESGRKEVDTIFDVKGLAAFLKVKPKWLYDRTYLKEIPHIKIDGTLRFRKRDIDKWLSLHNVPAVHTQVTALRKLK